MSFSMHYDEFINKMSIAGVNPYFPSIRSACGRQIEIKGLSSLVNFASCDYLGLANDTRMKEAAKFAIDKYGTNISGSMMLSGYTEYHEALEYKLGEWFLGYQGLIFTTSYLGNIGVIPMLINSSGVILIDKLSHSSLIQGSKFSNATIRSYKHCDLNSLEKLLEQYHGKDILIVTDGVFSADGDIAPLRDIVHLKEKYGARLYVDDAHGVGILGANGCGVAEQDNVLGKVDYILGTMSKAFGSTGGFLLFKSERDRNIVRTMCTTYTSSRAVSPGVAAASLKALEINEHEGNIRRETLFKRSKMLTYHLDKNNFNTLNTSTPIIPIVFRKSELCFKIWEKLVSKGIMTSVFPYPYVPKNTARLRLGVSFNHTTEDIDNFANLLMESVMENEKC